MDVRDICAYWIITIWYTYVVFLPKSGLYRPGSHPKQNVLLALFWYFPGGHAIQMNLLSRLQSIPVPAKKPLEHANSSTVALHGGAHEKSFFKFAVFKIVLLTLITKKVLTIRNFI